MRRSFLAVLAVSIPMLLAGCGDGNAVTEPTSTVLVVEDITIGGGAVAAAGDFLTVHYVGTLESGSVFDSSYNSGRPFEFQLGAGRVIAGWDQGLVGMRVGGKRRLVIPPSLAYGSRGQGPIPGNATIRFEVELLSIRR